MAAPDMVTQINDAIGAHGLWKMRLQAAVRTGKGDVHSHEACVDNRCAFGKWLHGSQIDPQTKAGVPYSVVRRLHAEFHASAGKVLASIERGDRIAANTELEGPYAERTDKLVRALMKWKGELQR